MQLTATYNDGGWQQRVAALAGIDIDRAVRKGVNTLAGVAKKEITGKDGLSKYPRHKRGTPTPSQPGEPPAQVSTALRKSVEETPIVRSGFAAYERSVMPTMVYARAQELGNPNNRFGVLPARPFVGPARDRMMANGRAERILWDAINKELDKARGK